MVILGRRLSGGQPGQRLPTGAGSDTVDQADLDRLTAAVIADIAELAANLRRERDRRRAVGDDTAWLDHVLRELAPLVEQSHDLAMFQAVRAVVDRHGSGPYPAAELATIAGVDVEGVRRVLDLMVGEGLAAPADESPDDS